jgi:hypothetical protein
LSTTTQIDSCSASTSMAWRSHIRTCTM